MIAKKGFSALKVILIILGLCIFYLLLYFRGNWVETESFSFTESSCALPNPNRGFYRIYGFRINDEETDYEQWIREKYQGDQDTCLTQVQINLQTYRNGAISQAGLSNIEALFTALEGVDKQLIVRFLYDWDGENEQYEPESLDIVLEHMGQLEATLRKHSGQIFTLQGLFIGNWGELNGTKHFSNENIKILSKKLAQVTSDSTYLAVRTPVQWRVVTQSSEPTVTSEAPLANRVGLFNDGMMGNEGDYGTYGTQTAKEAGVFGYWNREEELHFQEALCQEVPNGGEVIIDNIYNDFENAKKDLATMHVTYLNRDYDQEVFDKWAKSIVKEEGCFDGMDGLTYMERHMGYRLLIADVALGYDFPQKHVSVDITLQNVGFAPLYKEYQMKLYLYSKETEQLVAFDLPGDLYTLSGGNQSGKSVTLHADIPLKKLDRTTYTVYFLLIDKDSQKPILLANEQPAEQYGYPVGRVVRK